MTYQQALQALHEGKQIYHKQLTGCYQIYIGSSIIDGHGNDKQAEFEQLSLNPDFASGWSLEPFEEDIVFE